jgi:hypothetical protein
MAFLLTTLVVVATPGTGAVYSIAAGLSRGSRDGVGGARASTGSGLSGLHDRIEALDGTLALESSPGSGTRIRAEIPLAQVRGPSTSPDPYPSGQVRSDVTSWGHVVRGSRVCGSRV